MREHPDRRRERGARGKPPRPERLVGLLIVAWILGLRCHDGSARARRAEHAPPVAIVEQVKR